MECQECEKLIDEYLDRQMTSKIRKQIFSHLQSCQKCSQYYQENERLLSSIHNLKIKQCPNEVVNNVYNILKIDKKISRRDTIFDLINEFVFLHTRKFGLIVGVLIIFFFAIFIYHNFNRPTNINHYYTEAEIEQAKSDVKLALAYINQVTIRTEQIIEKQVLSKNVIKPMKSSIKTAIEGVGLNKRKI